MSEKKLLEKFLPHIISAVIDVENYPSFALHERHTDSEMKDFITRLNLYNDESILDSSVIFLDNKTLERKNNQWKTIK